MKYLVFDSLITGHHLEYIHHIYDNCNDSDTFIFVIPEDFAELKKLMYGKLRIMLSLI